MLYIFTPPAVDFALCGREYCKGFLAVLEKNLVAQSNYYDKSLTLTSKIKSVNSLHCTTLAPFELKNRTTKLL